MKTRLFVVFILSLLGSSVASAQMLESGSANGQYLMKIKPVAFKVVTAATGIAQPGWLAISWDPAQSAAHEEYLPMMASDCSQFGTWSTMWVAYPGSLADDGTLRPVPLVPTAAELLLYKTQLANLTAAIAADKAIAVTRMNTFCVIENFSISG